MDLRKRLTAWMGLFSLLLIACVSLYWLNAARADAEEELRASACLLQLIDALGRADANSGARARAGGGWRLSPCHPASGRRAGCAGGG
ncbi:MAG: hypothetical protein U1E47_01650 [Rivihabitans pingtungensis]